MEQEKAVVLDYDPKHNIFIFSEYLGNEEIKHRDYFAAEIDYDAQLLSKLYEFLGAKNAPISTKLGFSDSLVQHLKTTTAIEYYYEDNKIVMSTYNPLTFEDNFLLNYHSDNLEILAEDSFLTFNEYFKNYYNPLTL